MTAYPKRLIEVDLPIKRISAHARREKSIRHGHISTLHIWWARRPLAACRAVICAALWPDPADPICPQSFRDAASQLITVFADKVFRTASLHDTVSPESFGQWEGIVKAREQGLPFDTHDPSHLNKLRFALLDFIADFSNWDNSTVPAYLETSRALTQAAHEALGGEPGSRPLVVDPFAGGGSIPLEALRVGADAFASDLNPVAVLLNKVVLEYIPTYGHRLADEVRKWGEWIKNEAEKELSEFYPKDPDGATPIAYLWARTIRCEGPGCGAEVPLIRSLWLANKANRSAALQLAPDPKAKRVEFQLIVNRRDGWVDQANLETKIDNPRFDGTVKRGSATCPCCGYTTPVASVRTQLKSRRGGAHDARLFAVVTTRPNELGRFYRLPTSRDLNAVCFAAEVLERRQRVFGRTREYVELSLVPDEPISLNELRRISVPIYGMTTWGDLFTPRQALALTTLVRLVHEASRACSQHSVPALAEAVQTCLAAAVNRQADFTSSLCTWWSGGEKIQHTFCRQAIGMVWDFADCNLLSDSTGCWTGAYEWGVKVCEQGGVLDTVGHVEQTSATDHPLPDRSAAALVTDPPYYDAVPYAYLSDFFYVWMRRTLAGKYPGLFRDAGVPKEAEIVVDRSHSLSQSNKGIEFYERELGRAFAEGRRILHSDGIGTIVFASKTTASWESILKAVVDAGWIITGSWPIDTEMENRVSAQGQARLASSVHLVCRPRENLDGSIRTDEIGDWRDVLQELPGRIHEWMPRLAEEGVVGADAIFACLGPALEIFSRYSRVEKANGSLVTLRDYLEQVWAAVSKEALGMIFRDADATGLEEDARLTAIWFWVLKAARSGEIEPSGEEDDGQDRENEQEEQGGPTTSSRQGFALEYDAARKLAQGLGVDLYELSRPGGILKVSGNISTLFRVSEREQFLFGQQLSLFKEIPPPRGKPKRVQDPSVRMKSVPQRQEKLFDDEPAPLRDPEQPFIRGLVFPSDERSPLEKLKDRGKTTLDRLHQAMLLFGRSQVGLLRPFLIDTGMANNDRFWMLAQSLSALYPSGTEEKRWVDGVLARKKGLGF
jgi:putative DNA methylase